MDLYRRTRQLMIFAEKRRVREKEKRHERWHLEITVIQSFSFSPILEFLRDVIRALERVVIDAGERFRQCTNIIIHNRVQQSTSFSPALHFQTTAISQVYWWISHFFSLFWSKILMALTVGGKLSPSVLFCLAFSPTFVPVIAGLEKRKGTWEIASFVIGFIPFVIATRKGRKMKWKEEQRQEIIIVSDGFSRTIAQPMFNGRPLNIITNSSLPNIDTRGRH